MLSDKAAKTEPISTKDALADSFVELMLSKPFNKITIKNITDGAGVIRPTFYNYFRDKNEIFEYLLDRDLFEALYHLINLGMVKEAITMIFNYFQKNRLFYCKAFEVTGQNSFEEIFSQKLFEFYQELLANYEIKPIEELKALETKDVAGYYALAAVLLVKLWLQHSNEGDKDAGDLARAYSYLALKSLSDILEVKGQEEG